MSSNLSDSFADSAIFSHDPTPFVWETEVSTIGATVVSCLSKSIDLKLPLSVQDINPGNSPQLENIKVALNELPDETYQTFTNLVAVAEPYVLQWQELLFKAKREEPIPAGIFEEHENTMMRSGVNIINDHRVCITKKVDFIDESLDGLSLKIRETFERSEKKQYLQGQLDAGKDNIVPAISAINPVLAPAEAAGKVTTGFAAYHVSCILDHELKELGISDKTLRENVLIVLQTKSNLEGNLEDDRLASEDWRFGCRTIFQQDYRLGPQTIIQRIEFVVKRMLDFISPIKQYLIRINQYYGPGITVVREATLFSASVSKIFYYLNMIGSAKAIIQSTHRYKYETTVTELGLAIYEYLAAMKVVFHQHPINPSELAQFAKPRTSKFIGDTKISIYKLEKLLDKHASNSKIKDAKKKRMTGDRCFNSTDWRNRPPVHPEEVRAHLRKVDAAIDAIHGMSVAARGKILGKVDGQIERAHVQLDVTNPTLSGVHQTLNEQVEKGLNRYKGHQMEEKSSSGINGLLGGLWFNNKAH